MKTQHIIASILGLILISACTSTQLAEYKAITNAVPVTIGGEYNGLNAVYSTATGISIIYDASGKPVGSVAATPAAVTATTTSAPSILGNK